MGVNDGRPSSAGLPQPGRWSPRGPPHRYIWGIDGRGAHVGLSQPKPPGTSQTQGEEMLSNAIHGLTPKGSDTEQNIEQVTVISKRGIVKACVSIRRSKHNGRSSSSPHNSAWALHAAARRPFITGHVCTRGGFELQKGHLLVIHARLLRKICPRVRNFYSLLEEMLHSSYHSTRTLGFCV